MSYSDDEAFQREYALLESRGISPCEEFTFVQNGVDMTAALETEEISTDADESFFSKFSMTEDAAKATEPRSAYQVNGFVGRNYVEVMVGGTDQLTADEARKILTERMNAVVTEINKVLD